MKIRSIRHNNRRKVFEVRTSTKTLVFPFSQAEPSPTIGDPIDELFVDQDAGREAFTYGQATATGVEQYLRLIEQVVEKAEERQRTRRARAH